MAISTCTEDFRYSDIRTLSGAISQALGTFLSRGPDPNPGTERPVGCLLLGNGPAYIAALTAALRTGYDVAPLDPRLADAELAAILGRLRPAFVVAGPGRLDGAADLLAGRRPVRRGRLGEDCDLLVFGGTPTAPGPVPSLIFYTSGTSGDPKAVRHSADSALAAVRTLRRLRARSAVRMSADLPRVARIVRRCGGGELLRQSLRPARVLTTFGFSGMGGHTLMALCLLNGDTLVVPRSLHPAHLLSEIQRLRVSMLATTPAILGLLLKVLDPARHDTSSLCIVGVGGGPTDAALADLARRRLGCEVIISYGTTELGGSVLSTRPGERGNGSGERGPGTVAGRPLPGTRVRVVDGDGHPVPAGEAGELVGRRRGGDWVRTGDRAIQESRGQVRILGRMDDMLIRDGMNIYPAEVESVLNTHDAVAQSAIVPFRGPAGDIRVRALVVPREGCTPSATELIGYCLTRLAAYRVPDEVRFARELPGTREGETRSPLLRSAAARAIEVGRD